MPSHDSRGPARRLATWGTGLTAASTLGLAGVFVRALWFTPIERFQGPAQKIFYVHAPTAWAALFAFTITGLLSSSYLYSRRRRADLIAAASAEVGVALSLVMLTTGPIWGRAIWGTWWIWDARLTSTLLLFLLFVCYLISRGLARDTDIRAKRSAVIGVWALALVPFTYGAVYWFRTLHPQPVVLRPSAPLLPGGMLVTLLISVGVFSMLYAGLTVQRYALQLLREAPGEEAPRAIP